MNIQRTAISAVCLVLALAGPALAFHSGGVAECDGCHTMHNSLDGAAMTDALPQYQAGPYLLQGSDAGSACLNCHQHDGDTGPNGYHISTATADMPDGSPPLQLTPGGDFGWLKKTYTWVPRSGAATETSPGERHGHNIIAADYGYQADSTLTAAPGGDSFQYPASHLSCVSCHDPHGRYRIINTSGAFATTGLPIKSSGSYGALPDATTAVGAYRLLGGNGYQPKSLSGSYAFSFNPFIAVAPNTYNRSEETTQTRVAYGRSVSLWCANCHSQMHTTFGTVVHPADQQLGSTVAPIYNTYKKTGDLTGSTATAYLSLVPFQSDNITNIATLAGQLTSTSGPLSSDRVMCLSCHRAHATAWDSMMRWNMQTEYTTVADASGNPLYPEPGTGFDKVAQGRTTAEQIAANYGRPATTWAPYQRSLCNKCHAKD